MAEINPYAASAVIAKATETVARHPASRLDRFFKTLARPAVGLASIAVLHFTCSLAHWLLVSYLGWPDFSAADWVHFLWPALPAAILFLLSLGCLVRAIRARRFSLPMIVTVLLLSAGTFWYDVAHHRSQIRVTMATPEFWQNGGSVHFYCTWWWYEDGWFHKSPYAPLPGSR